jgi:hypothetical protein
MLFPMENHCSTDAIYLMQKEHLVFYILNSIYIPSAAVSLYIKLTEISFAAHCLGRSEQILFDITVTFFPERWQV